MSIKDTFKHMRELLSHICVDLEKSERGNKAASQRVRTGTVRLEKLAKQYRKESIAHEKKTKDEKKPSKTASSKKGAAKPSKPKPKAVAKAKVAVKAKPKATKRSPARSSVSTR